MSEENRTIEGYCVVCKEKRLMDDPKAVWTSNAHAGTRGTCPVCATTMFRMGRTPEHGDSLPPTPVQVVPKGAKGKAKRAAYVAASVADAEFARRLGEDLQQIGVNVWVDTGEKTEAVAWSTGVHPALEQCSHLIIVLASFAAQTSSVQDAWTYFRDQRKPILLVQSESGIEPPEELRSRARFDFTEDYKGAFRGLVEALSR